MTNEQLAVVLGGWYNAFSAESIIIKDRLDGVSIEAVDKYVDDNELMPLLKIGTIDKRKLFERHVTQSLDTTIDNMRVYINALMYQGQE